MQLTDLTWPAVAALDRDTPVVFPIAALEQHGRHMPVFTDSLLLGEVVRRATRAARRPGACSPRSCGSATRTTTSTSPARSRPPPRVYLDLLNDLLENFLAHGFTRLVFVNGHGGNIVPGQQAVFEVRQRHRAARRPAAAVRHLLAARRRAARGRSRDLEQTQMGHACEWETSMMLRLAPHLVGDLSKVRAGRRSATRSSRPAAAGSRRTAASPATSATRGTATAEKGEALFRVFADDVVALLERVIAWDGRSWDG